MSESIHELPSYVELQNINKYYGDFHASKDISFSIPKGKLVALLGPSGSGKTTILRMIAGLEQPDTGNILIDGTIVNDVPGSDRGIGFVFQNYALFRYMTVYENIAFGLRVKKTPKKEIDSRVNELLRLIDCEGLGKRYPSQLSGGQRQRVAFARALAPNPKLLLLDEPFAAIDAKVRLELRTWLRDMISRLGITSIFVTHDQDEAIEVADEIIVTNQGSVEQIGSPRELYTSPTTAFVADFIGNSVKVHDYKKFHYFREIGDESFAIIRPEHVVVYKEDEVKQYASSAEEGVVEDMIFRGSSIELRVRVNGELLSAIRSINAPAVSVGETVHVFIFKIYVVHGDQITLLDNESIAEDNFSI